jgi:uncharacterized phiE125 gp8 family phage protein
LGPTPGRTGQKESREKGKEAMRFDNYIVVVPPVGLPVTPEEYINHARLNGATVQKQPELIDRKLKAATQRCEKFCRLSLLSQTIKATFVTDPAAGAEAGAMILPRGNVQTVDSVTDADGNVVPAGGYTLEGDVVTLETPLADRASVVYVSGFGDDATAVPDALIEGILEYATTLYEARAGERESKYMAGAGHGLPEGVRDLWRPFQIEVRQ